MLAGLVRDDRRTLSARRAAVRAMAKSTGGANALLGMILVGAWKGLAEKSAPQVSTPVEN